MNKMRFDKLQVGNKVEMVDGTVVELKVKQTGYFAGEVLSCVGLYDITGDRILVYPAQTKSIVI